MARRSPNSVPNFFVGDVFPVGDAKDPANASHLCGLYPFLNVSCQGPRFTGVQEYGDDQAGERTSLIFELSPAATEALPGLATGCTNVTRQIKTH